MNQSILSYFELNLVEITLVVLLFIFLLIQLFFYFVYYRKPLKYVQDMESLHNTLPNNSPTVSVIIISENEAGHLSKHLPLILDQDYPDFDVIVVNNGSTDDSDEVLQDLKLRYSNLYHTYLPFSNDKVFSRRKLAITLGIKAAKGEVLLFTEPYSRPVSSNWISSMMQGMSADKDVVLGYSFYKASKQFFNRVARFDNHLFSMQYLIQAIKGKPYIGVYRNLAFRKQLFFDNKGFAAYLNLENGEDVFVNRIVNEANTSVMLHEDSFVETDINSYSLWRQIKNSYSIAKANFEGKAVRLFAFESFSRYVFYVLWLALLIYSAIVQQWALLVVAILFFVIRLVTQLLIINKSATYFRSGKFFFSLPLQDVIQPFYNLAFRTKTRKIKTRK